MANRSATSCDDEDFETGPRRKKLAGRHVGRWVLTLKYLQNTFLENPRIVVNITFTCLLIATYCCILKRRLVHLDGPNRDEAKYIGFLGRLLCLPDSSLTVTPIRIERASFLSHYCSRILLFIFLAGLLC